MTIVADKPLVITKPGVYEMTAEQYHADPVEGGSLSASGMRKLLPPNCPARFDYDRKHRPTPTAAMTFGHAAHKVALDEGPVLVIVEAEDWRTKAAKEAKAEALASGLIPLLRKDHGIVSAMAEALRAHPLASLLLDAKRGKREQALIFHCRRTGVMCRSLLDYLPDPGPGRFKIADYKTCDAADNESVSRAIENYGYHIQDFQYLDAVRTLGLAADPVMLFIFQEKTPPYLVNVVEVDPIAKDVGEFNAIKARRIYADCTERNHWPSYSDDVELIGLPPWAINRYAEETGK